jgi:hypothetical protein
VTDPDAPEPVPVEDAVLSVLLGVMKGRGKMPVPVPEPVLPPKILVRSVKFKPRPMESVLELGVVSGSGATIVADSELEAVVEPVDAADSAVFTPVPPVPVYVTPAGTLEEISEEDPVVGAVFDAPVPVYEMPEDTPVPVAEAVDVVADGADSEAAVKPPVPV